MTLKILSLHTFFISATLLCHQETLATMEFSELIENKKKPHVDSVRASQESTDDISLSTSSSSESKEDNSPLLLPLSVKKWQEKTPGVELPLKLEGKISKEDILSLKDDKYTNISLHRAYSYENFDCLKNNYFIVSPLTFSSTIQELTLRSCGLTDEHLTDIGLLENLKVLKLPSNLISDKGVTSLVDLPQLRILDLSNNYLNNVCIEILSRAPLLKDVSVRNNEEITGESLQIILKYSSSLKSIDLGMSGVSRKEFSDFKRNYKGQIKFSYSLG